MARRAANPSYVTPGDPLLLASTVFRQENDDREEPGRHDLMVMTLEPDDLARLLRAYDYALQILMGIRQRQLLPMHPGEIHFPMVDLPVVLPVTLHCSSFARDSGWPMLDCDPWTLLPQAFPRELLGPPNHDCDPRESFTTRIQVYERHGIAMVRIHPNEGRGDLPENFQTEELPMDNLRNWHERRKWSGEVLLHEAVNYAGY